MICFWIFGHQWSKWTSWGITYQIKYCVKCGKGFLRSL